MVIVCIECKNTLWWPRLWYRPRWETAHPRSLWCPKTPPHFWPFRPATDPQLLFKHLNAAAGNVLTLAKTGYTEAICQELSKYRISLAGLTETHLLGSGQLDIDDHTVIHSGEEQEHRRGIALVLDKKLSRSLCRGKPFRVGYSQQGCFINTVIWLLWSHMHQLNILPWTAKMSSTSLLNQSSPPDLLMTKLWSSVT